MSSVDPRDPEIVVDPGAMDLRLFGLSVGQLRNIVEFYKRRTGDVDCERVEFFAKNL